MLFFASQASISYFWFSPYCLYTSFHNQTVNPGYLVQTLTYFFQYQHSVHYLRLCPYVCNNGTSCRFFKCDLWGTWRPVFKGSRPYLQIKICENVLKYWSTLFVTRWWHMWKWNILCSKVLINIFCYSMMTFPIFSFWFP